MRRFSIVVAATLLWATPASAATRYAIPTPAAGADCTQADPCGLATALSGAANGDTVKIGSGTYGSTAAPLTLRDLDDASRALTIEGVMGVMRPVIHTAGGTRLNNNGSLLRDLQFSGNLELNRGRADRILVQANRSACYLAGGAVMFNSVCATPDPYGDGVYVASGHAALFRHLTVVSANTGWQNLGVATAANTSLEGTKNDVYNHDTATLVSSLADVIQGSPVTQTGTVAADPVHRGPGDYRQGPGAPTIDAGSDAESDGTYDLNGNLRKIGSKVDIGAYEQPPAPQLTGVGASDVTSSGAAVSATVQRLGGAVSYHVEFGTDASLGSQTTQTWLPGSLDAVAIPAQLTGLTPRTTYHFRAVATSDGGTVTSPVATFTTATDPPSAGAVTVSGITASGATLTAAADTRGVTGTAHFVVDGVARPAIATSGGSVTDTLTGLTPGTTHTVKLVVTTGGGTAESAPQTFTTTAAPAPPLVTPPPPVFRPTLSLAIGKGRAAGQLLLSRRTVTLFVRCGGVSCTALATGTVKSGKRTLGALKAPRTALALAADSDGRLLLRSSAKLRKKVRAYLKRHRRARIQVVLKATFTGTDGTRVTRDIKIDVRRLRR